MINAVEDAEASLLNPGEVWAYRINELLLHSINSKKVLVHELCMSPPYLLTISLRYFYCMQNSSLLYAYLLHELQWHQNLIVSVRDKHGYFICLEYKKAYWAFYYIIIKKTLLFWQVWFGKIRLMFLYLKNINFWTTIKVFVSFCILKILKLKLLLILLNIRAWCILFKRNNKK